MKKHVPVLAVFIFLVSSCQTISHRGAQNVLSPQESPRDLDSAIESVAEGISGHDISQHDLQNLKKELRTDPQARSAVESIEGSITNKDVRVKYCPVDGERFAASLTYCPKHHVLLKDLEE